MVFSPFRKRLPEPAAPVIRSEAPAATFAGKPQTAIWRGKSSNCWNWNSAPWSQAHGVPRRDRSQRISSGAQPNLFAAAVARRCGLEYRELPQPPHLQRPPGLAAGRNTRSYLIQGYARAKGNGVTVMMREIDVPIRVKGRHWGGFRTAYKL
jgi:hypothetical protein